MKTKENMNAGEGLCDFLPAKDLIVVSGFPVSMTLNGSDANNFVYHKSTKCCRLIILAKGLVFGGAKLGDARSVECANGKPLECKQRWNHNTVPINVSNVFL